MKKIYVMVFCLLLGKGSIEQGGASIVYDPTNGVQIASMLSTLGELKEVNEQWRATAEFLQKIKSGTEQTKRFIKLMDGMLCLTDQTDIYLKLAKGAMVCGKKLELDLSFGKIADVSSRYKLLIQGSMVLTQYETIKTLEDLNNELESAMRSTADMNKWLGEQFRQSMLNKYDKEAGGRRMTQVLNMNI